VLQTAFIASFFLLQPPADPAAEDPRLLAATYRAAGEHARAEEVLQRILGEMNAEEPGSLKKAALLEEIAAVQRAQGHAAQALATIEKAIEIRGSLPDSPRAELARDLTTAAALRLKTGDAEQAIAGFQRAIQEWDQSLPGDAQALTAIEALATVHRERGEYSEAKPLWLRSLRMRESIGGPDGPEIITAVDSLGYVEFGLRNLSETEALYLRLAALWEKNAGPDHPMLALTFDKLAEFYAFQQRYVEAEKYARDALAIRTRHQMASLNQTGRVLLMEAKIPEAEALYRKTVQVGDLVEAPDDALDPVLRIYAKILRELKRTDEADALDRRVKEAIYRKSDREGLLTLPVKPASR
jgi:tetratricopeptide (TPR) repeat protein